MPAQGTAAAPGSPLPYGIRFEGEDGWCEINSALQEQLGDDPAGRAAAHALESLLLAMHSAGIQVNTPQMAEAVTTAVEAIANNLPDPIDADEDQEIDPDRSSGPLPFG